MGDFKLSAQLKGHDADVGVRTIEQNEFCGIIYGY
jgi:hypothetical protein